MNCIKFKMHFHVIINVQYFNDYHEEKSCENFVKLL